MIESKSSGVNAQLQQMSWNEWKSARASTLRRFFYLYLVGNLRSDLGDTVPFIRTVHDTLSGLSGPRRSPKPPRPERSSYTSLHFKEAEHLNLGVRKAEESAAS